MNQIFKRNRLAHAVSLATLSVAATVPGAAPAQEQAALEEILVTASRRVENIRDIPINITAVDGGEIERLRLRNISAVAHYVPGLTVVDRGPRDEVPDILVRGLNTTGLGPGFLSNTVATYLGEIPLLVDLMPVDLERVEALIGPQGTLYGQGTMGGAIRYIPREADPDAFELSVRADVNIGEESGEPGYEYGITLNVPLIEDTLGLRVNVDRRDDPGFIDYDFVVREAGISNPEPDFSDPEEVAANLRQAPDANFEDTVSYRVNLRWLPMDDLDINLWYYRQETDTGGRQLAHRLALGTDRYQSGLRYEEPNEFTNELLSLDVSWDFGWAEATFVYGASDYEEEGQRDQTDLLLNFEYGYELFPTFSSFTREIVDEDAETIEIRLASQHGGRISWVAGYFRNEIESNAVSEEYTPGFDRFAVDNLGGIQLRPDALEYVQLTDHQEQESAFYGELSFQATPRLSLTLGYRNYEFEVDASTGFGLPLFETVFLGAPQDAVNVDQGLNVGKDQGDLFKVNASFDVDDDDLVYFTWAQGYRNGGVNTVPECTPEQLASDTQQLCALADEVFIDPDEIDSYEIGYKGLFAEGSVAANLALYYIDWRDLQVSTTTVNGSLPITGNGSEATSKGVEFQGDWLINGNWRASLSYAYTRARLTADAPGLVGSFDALDGARLPGSPEHQGAFNLSYKTTVFDNVDLVLNYGVVYTGEVYNITGGDEDPLVDPDTGLPGDHGGEAIPAYDVHHLSATFEWKQWRVQAYVDNLTDEYYVTGTRTSRRFLQDEAAGPGRDINGFTLRTYGQYIGAPRNAGLRVVYEF